MKTLRLPKRVIYEADPHQLVDWIRRVVQQGIERIEFHDADDELGPGGEFQWIEQPD